ncbi:MAG: response regulator transcription factor [Pseudomonadota bacterium]
MTDAPSTNPVARTLVVEDDQNILNLLAAYLENAGHQVVLASDGTEGLEKALAERFDICVFDVMLPRTRGTEIAASMRENGINTPIVFLTALGTETDILTGFNVGADDYLVKPFSPRELMVRIDAILRRSAMHAGDREDRVGVGPIQLDETALTCQVRGVPLELTPHEFRILRQLVSWPNRVFERGALIACLYGNAHAVNPKAIDVHVHHLRTKLGDDVGAMIQTVRGFGYKLAPRAPEPASNTNG